MWNDETFLSKFLEQLSFSALLHKQIVVKVFRFVIIIVCCQGRTAEEKNKSVFVSY